MATVKSHITFMPNTNVDFIKISQDIDSSLTEALAKRNVMKIDSVLLTKFTGGEIRASYFATDDNVKSVFTIYKKTPYQNYYQYVCTLDDDYQMTDYNVVSNQFYHYLITVEIPDGAAPGQPEYMFYSNTDDEEEDNYLLVKFDGWTICDVEMSEEDDNIYLKTGRMWQLGLNLENEDLTVNQAITNWDTLGKFPKLSMGQRKYQSMSFTSLLGKMEEFDDYTFTTEEGVSTGTATNKYKYTEKAETYNTGITDNTDTLRDERWGVWREYARENDKLESWNKFITNGSLKLLRDMKGNGWVIFVSDSTNYNIATTSTSQQTAITFQWKEALDISEKSIVKFGDNTED